MVMRVLVMAGGTGGHIFPALAVARRLRDEGVDVVWMGTRHGLEAQLVPKAGFPMEWVSISGLRGKGVASWSLAPFKLLYALFQSLVILMRCRPMAVLGMGGFVTGPGGLMAWLLKKPLLIHEQNAVAGLTNRLLARVATTVMQAFPATLPERNILLETGNPVREEISALAHPKQRMAQRQGAMRLLVLGGSLGAASLNEVVPKALSLIQENFAFDVWHQAGARNIDQARGAYLTADVEGRVDAFIDDMAAAYSWADIVVCRAGALTVAELAAAGVASILVPYLHAVDDHQTRNAQWLSDSDAALLIPQKNFNAQILAGHLTKLWQSEDSAVDGFLDESSLLDSRRCRVTEMACAARKQARPDAAARVATACMEAAHG